MRRLIYKQSFVCAALLGMVVPLGLSGCAGGSRQGALYDQPDPGAGEDPRKLRDPAAAARAAQAEDFRRLMARVESLELDNNQLKKQLSDQYMEAVALKRAQIEAQKKAAQNPTKTPKDPAKQPRVNGGADSGQAAAPADLTKASRLELLDALVKQLLASKEPDKVKALTAAALSLANTDNKLDPALLEKLDPKSREQVARFHQMIAVLFDELAGDKKRTLTRREMVAKIDEVFGAQPLSIEALELCKRVDSYGVYTPFATNRFLSGRKNRVLVYVELENFHHEPTSDGKFEVRLEQSVELYDATGEATVWRQGPVELVDVSRRERRDFFVVYPIDLPARLTAGIYRLKVRVADKHTGSICEKTMHNITIVADKALVGGGK